MLGLMKPGADPEVLATKYGQRSDVRNFKVYRSGGFFIEEISPEALASLRCEADIMVIEYNGVIKVTSI